MATSIFDDKATIPNDEIVDKVLAGSSKLWVALNSHITKNYKDISKDWKFYNKKAGWSLVFKQKKRTLFYFIPCDGYFMIAFVFGAAAEKAAQQSEIPEHIKEIIADAVSYVEGKSFFIDVKDEKDLASIFRI
jgi:hypothetical protein